MVKERARILVAGGGLVGTYTALRLQRTLRAELSGGAVEILVITPRPWLTYLPFLPEAASGSLSPRHVVVPLRQVLDRCRVVAGEITSVDHASRTAYATAAGRTVDVPYDELVLALGRVPRLPPRPGLAEHALGFHGVEDAIGLRNHVVAQLDIASSTRDPAVRDAALTFVFAGGGLAGAGALGELEDMARQAVGSYATIAPSDLRWVLAEPSARLLPELPESYEWTAHRTLSELRRRGVDVRLGTRLESCAERVALLSDGSRFPSRTVVWTAETSVHPVLAAAGLPLDPRGRVRCTRSLTVADTSHAWAAGDAASVPCPGTGPTIAPTAGPTASPSAASTVGPTAAPTAEHALRQAELLGDNIARSLHGRPLEDYVPESHAVSVPLGLHKAVAQVNGRRLTGLRAWLLHRAHHLGRLPHVHRRARVLAEWSLAGLFTREVVSLGSFERKPTEFELAGEGIPPEDPKGSF